MLSCHIGTRSGTLNSPDVRDLPGHDLEHDYSPHLGWLSSPSDTTTCSCSTTCVPCSLYLGTLAYPCSDITLLPERDETGTKGFYRPIIFPNEFWHLRSQYIEINETTPVLPIQITFQPMTYWKFQIFATMTASFKEAAKQQGAASVSEMDEIKRMLVETNPYFLALTGLVSLLHVLYVLGCFQSRERFHLIRCHSIPDLSSLRSVRMLLIGERKRKWLGSPCGEFKFVHGVMRTPFNLRWILLCRTVCLSFDLKCSLQFNSTSTFHLDRHQCGRTDHYPAVPHR